MARIDGSAGNPIAVIPAQAGIHAIQICNNVYIITNKAFGTLYIGVTNDLQRRFYEHKEKLVDDFTKKYSLDKLVYYEIFDDIEAAIHREKCMKEWNRNWKLRQIMEMNPDWKGLYDEIAASHRSRPAPG
ncbi:MAG: GIY-YIG nuclease family protein [Alphaproteobacteria bacterium]